MFSSPTKTDKKNKMHGKKTSEMKDLANNAMKKKYIYFQGTLPL